MAKRCINPDDRAAEKQRSRDRDMRDLVDQRRTLGQINVENIAIQVSGEPIDFASSTSRWW